MTSKPLAISAVIVALGCSLAQAYTYRAVMEGVAATGNTVYVDTVNTRVGIANSAPSVPLHVTGAAYATGNLTVDGALNSKGNVTLGNNSTNTITLNGEITNLTANGNVTLGRASSNTVTLNGRITTLDAGGSTLRGDVTLGSGSTNTVTLNGQLTDLTANGNIILGRASTNTIALNGDVDAITVNGNVTLGAGATNTITLNGDVDSIIVNSNVTLGAGSTNTITLNGQATNITANGNAIFGRASTNTVALTGVVTVAEGPYAPFAVGTATLTVVGGKVGIGTTSPTKAVTIYAPVNTSYGMANLLSAGANDEVGWRYGDAGDNDTTSWVVGKNVGQAADGFSGYYNGLKWAFSTAGALGLGAAPTSMLDVAGGTTGNGTNPSSAYTVAQVWASTPTKLGTIITCSDCTNTYTLCVGTGTAAAAQWREVGTATGCK